MHVYVAEEFTDAEIAVLRRYFTNLEGPVFALVNLPEVVKGALFARYSRSSKSLRRLFLDEFVGDLDLRATLLSTRPSDSTVPTSSIRGSLSRRRRLGGPAGWRAPRLEQASNVLPRSSSGDDYELPRAVHSLSRLRPALRHGHYASMRSRSTRSKFGAVTRRDGPHVRNYANCWPILTEWLTKKSRIRQDTDFVYRQPFAPRRSTQRAASCGERPFQLGIYASGQASSHLLLHMPLIPARSPSYGPTHDDEP